MTLILSLLKALAVATPALIKLSEAFVAWYIEQRWKSMERGLSDAIRKAIDKHDQRDIEEAIGSPTAGEPSGIPGTIIVDKPHGGKLPH
jgi:hypothetical protein